MIKRLRSAIGSAFASFAALVGGSGYDVNNPRRKVIDRIQVNRQTANELLSSDMPVLRSHCRKLERNNPSARAIVEGLKAQVVGTGISLEPKGGNAEAISEVWEDFIRDCGIHGESIYDLQRLAIAEMPTAGEAIWRVVILPELAANGQIPIKILPLDSEWFVDDVVSSKAGFTNVSGVDVDGFGRAGAYFLANPSTGSTNWERVPADQINHIFERRRPVQNRGEPWMAPAIETLMNEGDLVATELRAAVNSAAPAMVLESDYHDDPDADYSTDNDPVHSFRLGGLFRLNKGEKLNAFTHTRPSQQIAPFRKMLRGDIAGSCRISQRYLDRDVSGANYSSMKADQIDNEKILNPVRLWFGEHTIGWLFKLALPYLCVKAGVPYNPRQQYTIIPDETPYLDPIKDITGTLLAIRGGLTTWEKEIGRRGGDAKEVLEQLNEELKDPILAAIFAEKPEVAVGMEDEPAKQNKQEANDADI